MDNSLLLFSEAEMTGGINVKKNFYEQYVDAYIKGLSSIVSLDDITYSELSFEIEHIRSDYEIYGHIYLKTISMFIRSLVELLAIEDCINMRRAYTNRCKPHFTFPAAFVDARDKFLKNEKYTNIRWICQLSTEELL